MGSVWGEIFRVATFGESHGPMIGAVVDGCPAGLPLTEADLQPQLDRRRPGQSRLTTARAEGDRVRIVSGVEAGITLGSPIALLFANENVRPADYRESAHAPRPSHADYTYWRKYGRLASSGGGRASARETVARVAAGALAEKLLRDRFQIEIVAWVSAVGPIEAPALEQEPLDRGAVDAHAVRCPDPRTAASMAELIERTRAQGDSVGGVATCVCRNVPDGWGEPVFDKLGARLAAAMLSIPACRAFEIGSGFAGCRSFGSRQNDLFVGRGERLAGATNRSGGIQGGISNGQPLVFRVGFKPPPTIAQPQMTADYEGQTVKLKTAGRHDPCVLPRAVPVVEAMAALTLADMAALAKRI
jgi:chorismate synthase